MSSTDKARQQLVDSMRKTKAAAASKKTAGKKTPRPATRVAKTTRKAASPATGKGSAKVEMGSGLRWGLSRAYLARFHGGSHLPSRGEAL